MSSAALVDAGEDAKILAGGQSLLPLMALRLGRPSVLVDIGRVPGLDAVAVDGDDLVIGAPTTHARLGRDPEVARRAPLLAEVAPLVAHAAVRNRGTLGGSLAHNDPAAEWPAVALLLGASVTAVGTGGARDDRGERPVRVVPHHHAARPTRCSPRCACPARRRAPATPSTR